MVNQNFKSVINALSVIAEPPRPGLGRVGSQWLFAAIIALAFGITLIYCPNLFEQPATAQQHVAAGEKKKQSLPWPEDYPKELRERKWNEPVQLVGPKPGKAPSSKLKLNSFGGARVPVAESSEKEAWDVLWARRLVGKGQFETWPSPSGRLRLMPPRTKAAIPENKNWTFLALDNDLEHRWFEYSQVVEFLRVDPFPPRPGQPDEVVRGVFFGWRQAGPGKFETYLVQMPFKEDPVEKMPVQRVNVGRAAFTTDPENPELMVLTSFVPVGGKQFPSRKLEIRLDKADRSPNIQVRAIPGKVRVMIDAVQIVQFVPAADPRGPLGIFIRNRAASFYKGSITELKVP